MSKNTTIPTTTTTASRVFVGQIKEGGWEFWGTFFSPTDKLLGEVKGLAGEWVNSEAAKAFQCWNVYAVGRDIVARPEGGKEVNEVVVGLLSEEAECFVESTISAVLLQRAWAYAEGGQGGVVFDHGLRSEVAEWRRGLLLALQKLEAEAEAARKATHLAHLQSLREAGWKEFVFRSVYYGSHDGCDTEQAYLFRPGLDISRWEGVEFGHGEHSCHEENGQFSKWLEELKEGEDYVEVD